MSFAEWGFKIFQDSTLAYHLVGGVDVEMTNPYEEGSIEYCFYAKNWIDTIQWHLEDVIRDPDILPVKALQIKRRIDELNQERTNLVESIDDWFVAKYRDVKIKPGATLNTESPAWALDRLSILELKIYHMEQEIERTEISALHIRKCLLKLEILKTQKQDLIQAIDQLLVDIEAGKKYMKVYKQMKMYNDPMLNPILYGKLESND